MPCFSRLRQGYTRCHAALALPAPPEDREEILKMGTAIVQEAWNRAAELSELSARLCIPSNRI
jgi:hypothetical protein